MKSGSIYEYSLRDARAVLSAVVSEFCLGQGARLNEQRPKASSRGAGDRARLNGGGAFVIAEIALSFVLLICAGLLSNFKAGRPFNRASILRTRCVGFRAEGD